MSRTARNTDRKSLAFRASHLALAGILLTGWSVAAIAVSASAHASVVAEDPADEAADEAVDAPAANTPAGSDNTDTANDSSSSNTNADDPAEGTDPADGEPATEGTETDEDIAPDEDTGLDEGLTEEEAGLDEELVNGELVDGELDSGVESDAAVSLQIAGAIGAQAAGTSISVTASGLMPQSRAQLWVFSEPRSLGEAIADDTGAVSMSASLPADLGEGVHTVVFEGYDVEGNPVESATEIVIDADGLIAGITENASTEGLDIPVIDANPKVPGYPVVVPLDDPGFVAAQAITALTLVTVAGVGLGAAAAGGRGGLQGGESGPGGGGLDTAVRGRADEFDDVEPMSLNRGARIGVALAGFSATLPRFSPLLARTVNDAAPLRAFTGIASYLLPLASLVLGIMAASSVGGLAEPAAAAFMLPLMVIGIFDALAGLIGAVSFAVVVAVSGGLVNAASVRSVIGVALVIAGPGLIASSFRDIRRRRTSGSAGAWERLTDLVVVPLIGAWTTIAIVKTLPDLGGVAFPIADQAVLYGLVALLALVAKVLLEEAAARWAPARMRALTPSESAEPGTAQQLISALVRTGVFLFIAAAFVGNVWQLWVAAALFLLPGVLALIAHVFKNSPGLWQILPEGIPLFAVMLVIGLVVTAAVKSIYGDSPEFAQLSFLWMAVPGFLLALLGLSAREPRDGDVRWYMRPHMTAVYRIGGVVVLVITVALALRG
jgi:methionine-rich copper-binding protein CopC